GPAITIRAVQVDFLAPAPEAIRPIRYLAELCQQDLLRRSQQEGHMQPRQVYAFFLDERVGLDDLAEFVGGAQDHGNGKPEIVLQADCNSLGQEKRGTFSGAKHHIPALDIGSYLPEAKRFEGSSKLSHLHAVVSEKIDPA